MEPVLEQVLLYPYCVFSYISLYTDAVPEFPIKTSKCTQTLKAFTLLLNWSRSTISCTHSSIYSLFDALIPSPSLLLLFFLMVLFHFRSVFVYILVCAFRPDFVLGKWRVEEEVIYGNKKQLFYVTS